MSDNRKFFLIYWLSDIIEIEPKTETPAEAGPSARNPDLLSCPYFIFFQKDCQEANIGYRIILNFSFNLGVKKRYRINKKIIMRIKFFKKQTN